jgi:hypothetical protein
VARTVLRAGDVAFAVTAALAAFLIAGEVLQIGDLRLEVPMQYGFETLYYLMLAKGILDHGGYSENPSLGAPFGQELHDLALGTDQLNLALMELIGSVFSDAGEVLNLFYLLSFPLVALAAYLAFRLLGVSPWVATVCAALYALLPFHFVRGPGHLFLSSYYAVPLGAYLVLAVATGAPLFVRRARGSRLLGWVSGRSALTVALCLVVGSAGIYWAAFSLFLLVLAAALRLVSTRRLAAVTAGAAVVALIALTVVVDAAPTLAYQAENGSNPGATGRPALQSELYGLKLADLVLPIENHRVDSFAELTARYRASTPLGSERGQTLGIVGTLGLVFLLAVAFVRLAGRQSPVEPALTHAAAAATLFAIILGTVGGGSTVFAHLVTPQLRGWNRISLFVAFFCLLAVALLLDWLRRALGSGTPARAAFVGSLILLLGVGVYDQTTSKYAPEYGQQAASFQYDRDFVRAIEAQFPRGAAVFQLPYHPFPEAGQVGDMAEYDLLRGYVHSQDLRWSFGAMKGRPEDWAKALADRPLTSVVPATVAVGFDAIFIDRFAYSDRAGSLERELGQLLRVEPIVSGDSRHSFFDVRPYEERLRRVHQPDSLAAFSAAVLAPISVSPESGLWNAEKDAREQWRWAVEPRAGVRVHNPSNKPQTARLRGRIERVWHQPAPVEVTLPDGRSVVRRAGAGEEAARIDETVRVPPGDSIIAFATDGPPGSVANDPRLLYFRLVDFTFTDERLLDLFGEVVL